jgi:hypothetical protein
MRQRQALLPGLLAVLLCGCFGQETMHTSWLERFHMMQGPTGPDVVQMDVALIERPLGDSYLDRELWAVADEQVLALDQKNLLEDNGFQIGSVGGITPPGLQALLLSEKSCANPRRITLRAGQSYDLLLGPVLPVCRFRMPQDGELTDVRLEQAQCLLAVVPTLTSDGRTTLRFTPQVRHGETRLLPRPKADLSGWLLQPQQQMEDYAHLSWEVTLAPNEYVVIGGRPEKGDSAAPPSGAGRPQTLGGRCFLRPEETPPVRRLLVIRTGRMPPSIDAEPGESTSEQEAGEPLIPPLASQASMSTVRGTSP